MLSGRNGTGESIATIRLEGMSVGAVYAAHYLARSPGRYVSAEEIARHGKFSSGVLQKALRRMCRMGLVRSAPGHGFQLAVPAERLSLLDVLRSIEGDALLCDACAMGRRNCAHRQACPIAELCQRLRTTVESSLAGLAIVSLPVGRDGLPVCRDDPKGPCPTLPGSGESDACERSSSSSRS